MEQVAFDEHEDRVGNLVDRLQWLVLCDEPVWKEPTDSQQKGLLRRLALIETELCDVSNAPEALEPGPELDCCLLKQHEEQISGLKSELAAVLHNIITLKEDNSSLTERRSAISKIIFSTRLQIQRLLQMPSQASYPEVIKLPKIDVATFKRDITKWQTFWEQSNNYNLVHSKLQLSDPVKLSYLQQALKDGPAIHVIEGLSGTVRNYHEDIKRYGSTS